jgi:hypothetical protein
MVEPTLEDVFPNLRGQAYQTISPRDGRYNCIAFAAGDHGNWWWPDAEGEDTWPLNVARVVTVAAFRDAFGNLGYVECEHPQLEIGWEKIALFALDDVPKHAARQLASGRWASKLGSMEDVEHELNDLTGTMYMYGSADFIMKRPRSPSAAGSPKSAGA